MNSEDAGRVSGKAAADCGPPRQAMGILTSVESVSALPTPSFPGRANAHSYGRTEMTLNRSLAEPWDFLR